MHNRYSFWLCLAALAALSGCAHKKKAPVVSEPHTSFLQPAPPAPITPPVVAKPAAPSVIKLYTHPEELIDKPFRDLGPVSGEMCQKTAKKRPARLAVARQRMLKKAETTLQANAVLLHKCVILKNTHHCYRQAVCQGTALRVSKTPR